MKRITTYALALVEATGPTLLGLGILVLGMAFVTKSMGAEPPGHGEYRDMEKSVTVIGLDIENQQGEYLGEVKELALDVENGRIVEVIVESGGFLGFGQRIAGVPPGAFKYDGTAKVLRLDMSKEAFKAAPSFKMSSWGKQGQGPRVAAEYHYFGQEPYFAADGQGSRSGNTATEPLGYIQLVRGLLYMPVINLQNKPLGEVHAFMFAILSSKGTIIGNSAITHVIVLSQGLLRVKRVIPARGLKFNAAHTALYLDLSLQAFNDEPQFEWSFGNNYPWDYYFRNAPILHGNSGHFHQVAYSNVTVAANNGVNTRQNVEEGAAVTYTPLAQGTSFRDVAKTYHIYEVMLADTNLSQNAENVEVATLNGRTTLRGHVNSAEGKRIIGEIAAKAGQHLPENVSNLLEVRPLPVEK